MAARHVSSKNLVTLTEQFSDLGSQKLLFAKSAVPTSMVGRIRRAGVVATVDNVDALAKTFRHSASDLLDPGLLRRQGLATSVGQANAYDLAAEQIKQGPWTEMQLAIIENTLAALRFAS